VCVFLDRQFPASTPETHISAHFPLRFDNALFSSLLFFVFLGDKFTVADPHVVFWGRVHFDSFFERCVFDPQFTPSPAGRYFYARVVFPRHQLDHQGDMLVSIVLSLSVFFFRWQWAFKASCAALKICSPTDPERKRVWLSFRPAPFQRFASSRFGANSSDHRGADTHTYLLQCSGWFSAVSMINIRPVDPRTFVGFFFFAAPEGNFRLNFISPCPLMFRMDIPCWNSSVASRSWAVFTSSACWPDIFFAATLQLAFVAMYVFAASTCAACRLHTFGSFRFFTAPLFVFTLFLSQFPSWDRSLIFFFFSALGLLRFGVGVATLRAPSATWDAFLLFAILTRFRGHA